MSDNVKGVDFNRDDFRGSVENIKRNLSAMLEYAAVSAQIKRAHYDALIEQGFTKDQAVLIAKDFPR